MRYDEVGGRFEIGIERSDIYLRRVSHLRTGVQDETHVHALSIIRLIMLVE